ncbi:hypothetical protein JCM9279_005434 [Rhodotorula babjevae]
MASAAAPQPATPAPRPGPRQRLNKLERTQLRRDLAHHDKGTDEPQHAHDHAEAHTALDWLPLADTRTHPCPVVFTPDGSYAFVASGAAVKVYSVASTQLMSTLSIRPYSSASSPSTTNEPAALRRATVSAVLLSPSNPRQLVVAATDGKVRLWDYLDGALLRTLDLGAPILHATANPNLADHLFVALGTNSTLDAEASVYLVSLRAAKHLVDGVVSAADPATPVQPARRVRLATPRVVRALALSPDGAVLASVTPTAVHLARTHDIQRGFTQSVPAADDELLTTVAFHPTDTYFATGNERGQIRLWYNVLGAATTTDDGAPAPAPTTSVLHWHAHAVSALAFTPNGAYLLSGGQEAVLVLWQLHTGHQEYVPRLGAPISSLTVLDGTRDNPEQQVAARLSDGSVAFVGSQRLRVGKVISGLKADASSRPTFAPAPSTLPTPLALDPSTSALVLPAAHPSSLQFYSPLDDASVLELEVAPSNRVTSAQRDRPLEPTRVERVAFSTPDHKHAAGAYWMATVDSWAKDGFTPVRQLKLWRKQVGAAAAGDAPQSFVLSTRIDRPHDGPITSLAFSPSAASPLLLTTSTDGSIKVWAPTSTSASSSAASGSWACRAALSHRGSAPVAGAWSADGSMFAVAHVRGSVTLWSLAQGGVLMHSFAATSVGRPRHVAFVEGEGEGQGAGATALVVAGSRGSIAWDLLTLDEVHTTSIDFATLAVEPASGRLLGTEDAAPAAASSSSSSSGTASKKSAKATKAASSEASTDSGAAPALLYSLPVASTSREAALAHLEARPLPFAPRQLLPLPPSSASTSTSTSSASTSRRTDAHAVSLAAVDPAGAVSLLGAAAALGGSVAPSALPRAAGTGAKEGLFDEIFGSASSAATSASRGKGKGRALAGDGSAAGARIDVGALGKGAAVLLETPAHVLPPVRMLWRELLRVEQPAAAAPELESEGGEGGSSAAGAAAASSTAAVQQRDVAASMTAPVFSSLGQEAMRGIFSRRLAGGAAGSA